MSQLLRLPLAGCCDADRGPVSPTQVCPALRVQPEQSRQPGLFCWFQSAQLGVFCYPNLFFFPFLGLCGLPVRIALGLWVSGSQPGHWIGWSRSHPLLTMRLLGPPVALLHILLVPTKTFSFLLPFQLSCCCFPRHKTANLGVAVWLRAVRSSQPAGFGV